MDQTGVQEALLSNEVALNRNVVNSAESADFRPVCSPSYQPQVHVPEGVIFQGDSISWLKSLGTSTVDMIFADPPCNIKRLNGITSILKKSISNGVCSGSRKRVVSLNQKGSLYICGFSEILADLKHPAMKYFAGCRWIVWHYRNKANLGNDWGRSHESILHFRKSKSQKLVDIDHIRIPYGAHTLRYPSHPQADTSAFGKGRPKRGNWVPHPMGAKPKDVIEVPTTCNGMNEKTPHPTQKPEELIRKFVFAGTAPGELIVDPFSGSGTTAVAAAQLGRRFLVCDLDPEYNGWAASRLQQLQRRTEDEWFEYDRANAQRRESIR